MTWAYNKILLLLHGFTLKNLLALLSISTLLTACAGLQRPAPVPADSVATAPKPAIAASAPGEETTSANEDSLPKIEMTGEMLANILAAEMAAQRGDWQSAYGTLMAQAERTRDPRLAARAVEVSLAAKKPEQALTAVRLWRTLAPNSEEAAQYFLSFAILTNNLKEAEPILAQRLQTVKEPARGAMMLQTQRLLSRARDKAAAFGVLESVLAPYASVPESHLALAQAAFDNGDTARAKAAARTALKLKPDSKLAILTLAQVETDKAAASNALSEFIAANPDAREVRIAYARMLAENKQYDGARQQFETLLKADDKDLTSLFALGVITAQTGDKAAAERYLSRYVDILSSTDGEQRDPTQAYLLLAQLAEERNDLKTATAWLDRVDEGESYLDAQVRRAELIAKGGDVAGARSALKRIAADTPHDKTAVTMAESRVLREAGQNEQAYKLMEAATKRFPEDNDVLYEYALIAEKVRKFDEMEAALRKIIKAAPKNHHAYNALGYSFADRNIRLQEALELITKALELAPEDPYIMDSLGWTQFRLGRLDEAEATLRRAYQLRPDAEIGVHLGEVLWVKGEKDTAQRFWRDAKEKDPKNDALRSTLNRLHVSI